MSQFYRRTFYRLYKNKETKTWGMTWRRYENPTEKYNKFKWKWNRKTKSVNALSSGVIRMHIKHCLGDEDKTDDNCRNELHCECANIKERKTTKKTE